MNKVIRYTKYVVFCILIISTVFNILYTANVINEVLPVIGFVFIILWIFMRGIWYKLRIMATMSSVNQDDKVFDNYVFGKANIMGIFAVWLITFFIGLIKLFLSMITN